MNAKQKAFFGILDNMVKLAHELKIMHVEDGKMGLHDDFADLVSPTKKNVNVSKAIEKYLPDADPLIQDLMSLFVMDYLEKMFVKLSEESE